MTHSTDCFFKGEGQLNISVSAVDNGVAREVEYTCEAFVDFGNDPDGDMYNAVTHHLENQIKYGWLKNKKLLFASIKSLLYFVNGYYYKHEPKKPIVIGGNKIKQMNE